MDCHSFNHRAYMNNQENALFTATATIDIFFDQPIWTTSASPPAVHSASTAIREHDAITESRSDPATSLIKTTHCV